MSDDSRWRLLLGLGAVPAFFVVVCSVLEARAAHNELKDKDFTASHALLNPAHSDQFHHEPDGGIGHSSHGGSSHSSSISSGVGPFHDSFGAGGNTGSRRVEPAAGSGDGHVHFYAFLRQPDTWVKLLVTGGGWYIYDVAYCKALAVLLLPFSCVLTVVVSVQTV